MTHCRPARFLALAAFLCLCLPFSAFSVQKPAAEYRVLPNFDSRMGTPAAVPAEVQAAVQRLDALLPGEVRVRFNPFSGGARVVSGANGVTPRGFGAPASIAQAFLAGNIDLFGLSAADLQTLVQASEYSGLGEGVTHINYRQLINGISVHAADLGVHVNRQGQIVFLTSTVVPNRGISNVLALSAAEAVQQAAADIRPELTFAPQLKSGPSGPDQLTVFAAGPFAKDLTARLVLLPTFQGLRLTWQTFVEPLGFPQGYLSLVDATNGQILVRRNIYEYAEGVGNVLQSNATQIKDARQGDEHPYGSAAGPPDYGCPPISNMFNRDLNSQFRDPATVLFNNGRLAGNDTHVWRANTGSEGALGTQVGSEWQFNFNFNTADQIETNLFFAVNFTHDFFYDLGFDEASRNFQEDNFGRGGLGGDSLNSNARAPGRNNANFSTPADGQKPTMNMFLWDGSGCWQQDVDGDGSQDLDGDLDYDIVIHEYHHGVTHRLNTSFGGSEAGAIGEGGGDFFGYSVNGDTQLGEYSAPPSGIRQVNAKTYGDWFCVFGVFCPVHDNGEIWANVMWDVRERFRTDLVKGSEQAAINESHQLYIDGLKLSPANPTMLEMRDSILQADLNRNPSTDPGGSVNYCRLWDEFAGRGMGTGALDTKDTGNNTVVENFSIPAACSGPPPPPPAAPSNLTATAFSATRVDLTWTDNSSNEDSFKIERCTGTSAFCDANPTNYAQIATTGANTTSYSDTTAAAATTYSYRVRAFNAGGNSGYSNTAEATTPPGSPPAAPSGLTATAGSTGKGKNLKVHVDLSWTDNSTNENNFVIERCQGSGCTNFVEIATVVANVTTYRDSSTARRTTYSYRVRARNAFGDSNPSNTASATTR